MLIKEIKFVDFNGVPQTVTVHFNISKTEVIEMEMNESQMAKDGSVTGGLQEKLDSIRAGGRGGEILQAFKDILFMAYGEKSEDGKYFRKSSDRSFDFASSPAYDVLFQELITDPDGAAKFMNAVLPAEWSQKAEGADSDKPAAGYRPMSPADRDAQEAATQVIQVDAPAQPGPTPEELEAYRKFQDAQKNGPAQ